MFNKLPKYSFKYTLLILHIYEALQHVLEIFVNVISENTLPAKQVEQLLRKNYKIYKMYMSFNIFHSAVLQFAYFD